jgi:hypothetical protein
VNTVKESDRRVLRAAARAIDTGDGNWPGNELIGEQMGGVDADVVADTLRVLHRNGHLRLDGAVNGGADVPLFVREITAKGRQALGGR